MAEELVDAAYRLPRVMTLATFANGLMGFDMLRTRSYCIGNTDEVLATPTGYPFIQVLDNTIGSAAAAAAAAMTAFIIIIIIIIILAAASYTTIIAGSSHQLSAFPRDQGVPSPARSPTSVQ